jgi:hypothetical protein
MPRRPSLEEQSPAVLERVLAEGGSEAAEYQSVAAVFSRGRSGPP